MRILLYIFLYCACNPQSKEPAHAHHGGRSMQNGPANYADSVNDGSIKEDTLTGSPARMAMANVGSAHIHVEYNSPGVRHRVIWGGLVPYDQVWVSGAHEATTINFSKEVSVMGKPVKAGTYAFLTIPGKEKWTLILNTRFTQHLTDEYNPAEDIGRFTVTPVTLHNQVQRLTYEVQSDTDSSGTVSLSWDKIKINLPVAAKPR